MDAILKIENLNKAFGGIKVCNNVSLEICKGKIYAGVGPNGAGKTSLFNLITGYIKPDSGSVHFLGENITNLQPYNISQKGISRSFQNTNIFPDLTVFQNVKLGQITVNKKHYNMFKNIEKFETITERTRDILEYMKLTHLSDELPRYLSHGDQKKVDIAVALAYESKLLIMDEPTSGMSFQESVEIMDLICKAKERFNAEIWFIEHDFDIINQYADIIIAMQEGSILAQGCPDEIFNNKEVKKVIIG